MRRGAEGLRAGGALGGLGSWVRPEGVKGFGRAAGDQDCVLETPPGVEREGGTERWVGAVRARAPVCLGRRVCGVCGSGLGQERPGVGWGRLGRNSWLPPELVPVSRGQPRGPPALEGAPGGAGSLTGCRRWQNVAGSGRTWGRGPGRGGRSGRGSLCLLWKLGRRLSGKCSKCCLKCSQPLSPWCLVSIHPCCPRGVSSLSPCRGGGGRCWR